MIAKYFAGREKDDEFCAALAQSGLVEHAVLVERLQSTEVSGVHRERMLARITTHFSGRS